MMAPTASRVTAADPEMAAKPAAEATVAMARPPGMKLVLATAKSISRRAMLPRDITAPANMNRGMASSTSLLNASQTS